MRAFLTIFIPLLLPSAIYWVYLSIRRQQGLPYRDIPWIWLVVAGLVLAAVSLSVLWFDQGADPTGRYVPPQVIDGVVVPGHFEPATETGQ
jgi:hypothetical protein